MEYKTWMWIFIVCCFFTLGCWFGFVLHESLIFKGLIGIAEGLEGTTFNIEVDINETEITDRVFMYFNETIKNEIENGTKNKTEYIKNN